jgi:chaperonin cofactor prefoldin
MTHLTLLFVLGSAGLVMPARGDTDELRQQLTAVNGRIKTIAADLAHLEDTRSLQEDRVDQAYTAYAVTGSHFEYGVWQRELKRLRNLTTEIKTLKQRIARLRDRASALRAEIQEHCK